MSSRSFAERHWYRLTPLSVLLLPLALLFGLVSALRRTLYRWELLRSQRLPVPVLVIGNLTVGGTGKTPLVLWAAGCLRAAGRSPGIILRGYRGAAAGPREVSGGDDALEAGDEAVLLAQRSLCPVWTGRDRAAAALALLAAHPRCDVIICDDGLQHYRLARDLEIAVEDERGLGNGLLLPAGPLREPATRAVDATVLNAEAAAARPGRVYRMRLQPAGFERMDGTPVAKDSLAGLRLHAVAGIGNPRRFFETLTALGLEFTPHAFPDHHAFTESDLRFADCDAVLMTEKDAVKCRKLVGEGARANFIMLRVLATPDPALADFVLKALHGPQTA